MAVSGDEFGDLRDRVSRLEERHVVVREKLLGGEAEFVNQRRHIDGIGDRLTDHMNNHPRCDDPCIVLPSVAAHFESPVIGPSTQPDVRAEIAEEARRSRERTTAWVIVAMFVLSLAGLLLQLLIFLNPKGGTVP